jgi:hypothetical protein
MIEKKHCSYFLTVSFLCCSKSRIEAFPSSWVYVQKSMRVFSPVSNDMDLSQGFADAVEQDTLHRGLYLPFGLRGELTTLGREASKTF